MRLLLDLGNTRLKWALQDGAGWLAHGAVGWDEEVAAALARAWAGLPAPAAAFGASVVDAEREARVAGCAARAFGIAPQWLRTPAEACGVRNAYAEPARLGVDRFLAMVAARADGLGACVLAGVGTALTLDALAADGRHLGGLIAPGPRLMRQALLGATAQVRPAQDGRVVEAADNTADAVDSGCWLAAAALVERFVARMAPRLGGAPALSLGGGDAEALAGLLALPARRSEDSVLRGLAVWAQAQSGAAPAA
ncbi:type III pantothenate kinase [Fulvimonas soli]|jgi:type III pantothenate kinase|uniref:Type III pantothenate kinase n=1 Tax=Fulvimonas soli TaxID=155197 RepID=A0A316I0F2_9GAMM|nr:type III pantothenate kinase [Fulvimonas soli]PWK85805.1 transcriptional regulator [Fulvimonas soli]TNY25084.1 type III pantothenate kinase [Fulvimonas soli]